jgi:3-oxoacyl-[acyl-carrier protein] reductase
MTIQDFDSLFAVNVRAPYFLVQQLLPSLGAGSSVVFLSSAATHAAVSNLSAYAATKGAVETLVRHFAFILGQHGIRVNAVAPGMVETDMSMSRLMQVANLRSASRLSSESPRRTTSPTW